MRELDAIAARIEGKTYTPADLALLVAEVERLRAAIEEHKRTLKPGDDYCGADVILWRAIDA